MIPMTAEQVRENLTDAGCGLDLIDQFEALGAANRREEQLRLLKARRALLMDAIHTEQRKLDCLDYLIYTLTQNSAARRKNP